MTKDEIQFLIQKYGATPSRDNGQNFLLDESVIAAMIAAANLTEADTVLEIGPGFGVLTRELASTNAQVHAVEADRAVLKAAEDLATQYNNLTIHHADIRKFHLEQAGLTDQDYSLVANLPYTITSWVIRQFLQYPPRAKQLVVMVQKEVADRILETPGKMSRLSVAAQCLATVERVVDVPRDAFYPAPQVDSAVIKLTLRPEPQTANVDQFMQLMRLGFAAKRKTLTNNLKAGLKIDAETAQAYLNEARIDPKARPQELSIAQWEKLRQIHFD